MDTSYPVQDSFYTESQLYEEYGGRAVWVFAAGGAALLLFAAGGAALLLFVLGLVILTAGAGYNRRDEELHLMAFDHWKTEISACLIFLAWFVPVILVGTNISVSSVVSYDEYGNMIQDRRKPDRTVYFDMEYDHDRFCWHSIHVHCS